MDPPPPWLPAIIGVPPIVDPPPIIGVPPIVDPPPIMGVPPMVVPPPINGLAPIFELFPIVVLPIIIGGMLDVDIIGCMEPFQKKYQKYSLVC
jgi:hypothetical protein